MLEMAGIKDIYAKTYNSKTKLNLMFACFSALKQLAATKVQEHEHKALGITIGPHHE